MSHYQVAVLYTVIRQRIMLEEASKHFSLPYPIAITGIDAAIEQADREQHIAPIVALSPRWIRTARGAIARIEREIAVLRVLEALRIFGARHEGKLPEQLSDITEVPVPNDPVTGEPFVYLRDGQTATLREPTLRNVPLNYEIEMVRPE